jgi:hypothetical protein
MLRLILLVFLIIALLSVIPIWPYSMAWGFYPAGSITTILLIILILILIGRL